MRIQLYGHLAQQFGKHHAFEVSSPGEAMRAMNANYPAFEQAFLSHATGYHVIVGYGECAEDDIPKPCSNDDTIRIVPSVTGSGLETMALWFVANLGVSLAVGYGLAIVTSIAISMALSAVSNMLFAPSKQDPMSNERPENRPSNVFNGAVNTTQQGNAVAVGYGRLRVGSQVISAGLSVDQIPVPPPPDIPSGGDVGYYVINKYGYLR